MCENIRVHPLGPSTCHQGESYITTVYYLSLYLVFPDFDFVGRMLTLIVLVSGHCYYFT